MSKVLVIGGGPAGCFAAIAAAEQGHQVVLLERNEKIGKKLFITGKGRCNLTNACDTEELFSNIPRNSKFLYSAIYSYDNFRVMDFFEQNGTPVKVERGNRVFPVSDHSSDVIAALKRSLDAHKVKIMYHTAVEKLMVSENCVHGVITAEGKKMPADAVVIATGGCSYASTGSTGDGYRFAEACGHTIKTCSPSLVPFNAEEEYVKELQGLSLKNVKASIYQGKKLLYEAFGEMLFTHFGVSGPLMLSASSVVNDAVRKQPLQLYIDWKSALSEEQLDHRILRDFEEAKNRQVIHGIEKLYPSKFLPIILKLAKIPAEKRVNEVTKEERQRLVDLTKKFPVTLTGLRGFSEAIITKGGVSVKEVNPSTMESKLTKHLYFAGEVLDLDAFTGGFNLQIAWSTGYLAGSSIGNE